MRRRAAALAFAGAGWLAGCAYLRPEPQIITRVDTVTVVREVAPPLADGDSVEVCLSTGMPARVRVTAHGDTLIGEQRVPLRAVQPVLAFAGTYAEAQPWFARDTLRFEKRLYRKAGALQRRGCDELKSVGDFAGVPIFADVTAPQPLPAILLPVRPGQFQLYTMPPVPRRR